MRCPNHATVDVRGGDSSAPLNHFVRCDHREAQYVEDPFTGRHSVVVPYEPRGGYHDGNLFRLKVTMLSVEELKAFNSAASEH
jgi:hypothetical protein